MSDADAHATTRGEWIAVVLLLLAYVAALVFRHDTVPAGLSNDTAEEALRGLVLLDERRLTPMAAIIGHTAETGYLYLVALSASLFGTTLAAIQLVSGACALATAWFTALIARRVDPVRVRLPLALAVALSSTWLFHYARSGLRAISAALVFAAFVVAVSRGIEGRRGAAWVAGALLALGLYTYTAFRVVPIAAALAFLVLWWTQRVDRAQLVRIAIPLAATAIVVSIPNIAYAIADPAAYFGRGRYVAIASGAPAAFNLVHSVLLPFWSPEHYDVIKGPFHFFDPVSVGYTAARLAPMHPLLAIAAFAGLWTARKNVAFAIPLALVAVAIVLLGPSGPSLTRFLVALPVLLAAAALALARLPSVAGYALVALAAAHYGYAYFARVGSHPQSLAMYTPQITPLARCVAELARGDAAVLAVVHKDRNVVYYHAFDERSRVRVVEQYGVDIRPDLLPLDDIDTVVVEQRIAPSYVEPLRAEGYRPLVSTPAFLVASTRALPDAATHCGPARPAGPTSGSN